MIVSAGDVCFDRQRHAFRFGKDSELSEVDFADGSGVGMDPTGEG